MLGPGQACQQALGAHGDEEHAAEVLHTFGGRGHRPVVHGLVDDEARLLARGLRQAEGRAGRGQAGVARMQHCGPGGRDRIRVDAQGTGVAHARLDQPQRQHVGVGRGRGCAFAVEDAVADQAFGLRRGLEGRHLGARHARAVARGLQFDRLVQPPAGGVAQRAFVQPASGQVGAVQRLQRLQRLAQPRLGLDRDLVGVAVVGGCQALLVPAADHQRRCCQQQGRQQQRNAHGAPPRQPVGARLADQRQRQGQADQHAQRVADPPGAPVRDDLLAADGAIQVQHRRGQRGVHQARTGAEQAGHRDVARPGQHQRLRHPAPQQRRAQHRLQHRPAADGQRHPQRRGVELPARGAEHHVDAERAQQHTGPRRAAVGEHRRQRHARGRVQRRRITRRHRQQQRQPADHGVRERRAGDDAPGGHCERTVHVAEHRRTLPPQGHGVRAPAV